MDKFENGEDAFKLWEFGFLTVTGSICPATRQALQKIAAMKQPLSGNELASAGPASWKDLGTRATELFELLCMLTKGEAKLLIRETPGGDGFIAWHALCNYFARRTLAKLLKKYRAALIPKQVSHVKDVMAALVSWEAGVRELERTEGHRIDEMAKLAALTEICPEEVRDLIFQHSEDGTSFTLIRDKVIGWVSNKVSVPVSTNPISNVEDWNPCPNSQTWDSGWDFGAVGKGPQWDSDWDIGAIGKGPKGAGKFGGKFGKGTPKGGMPTPGDDKGKGKGKFGVGKRNPPGVYGYQGTCWLCNKVGHKQAECPLRQTNNVEEHHHADCAAAPKEESAGALCGGIWMVAHVGSQAKVSKARDPMKIEIDHPVKIQNRFSEFEEEGYGDGLVRHIGHIEESSATPPTAAVQAVEHDRCYDASSPCGMTFHLTDAKRMLASVARVTEAGNDVKFGEGKDENYIQHRQSGRRLRLHKEGNVYVLYAKIKDGDTWRTVKIVIDSGAAENVMPRSWLPALAVLPRTEGVNFVGPDGKALGNYGRKFITFLPETSAQDFTRQA